MTVSARPTSIRFTEDERELLDAFRAYMHERHGINLTRTSAIKHLLKRAEPPAAAVGPAAARYRVAYTTVFRGAAQATKETQ